MLIIYRLTSHFKCYFTVRVGDAILHVIIKWTAILQQQQGGRTNQCRQIQNPDYCKEKFHSSRGLTPAQLDLDFIAESGEHRNSCGKCYYRLIQHGSWITSVSFEEAELVSLGEEKPLRGLLWHFHFRTDNLPCDQNADAAKLLTLVHNFTATQIQAIQIKNQKVRNIKWNHFIKRLIKLWNNLPWKAAESSLAVYKSLKAIRWSYGLLK